MSVAVRIPVARPQLPTLKDVTPYLERIDANRWYSNFGPLCEELHARLARRYGLPAEGVVSIANATVGLVLALLAVRRSPSGFCIVPSWTFPASIHAVLEAGLEPLLVDVDDDGLLTPAIARAAVAQASGPVAAVMPVAVYGQPIDAADWDRFADETGIPVVVDAAPGYDAVRPGRVPTVVSLHATKILGVGEGGFVMSSDEALVRDIRQRSNFGFYGSREAKMQATNGKLSEYAAAVGLAGMDQWTERRARFQAVADRYLGHLNELGGAGFARGWGQTWLAATCILRAPQDIDDLARTLADQGIETRAWWGRGMHLHQAFREAPRLDLSTTERLGATTLGLPCSVDMSAGEIDEVCGAVAAALG